MKFQTIVTAPVYDIPDTTQLYLLMQDKTFIGLVADRETANRIATSMAVSPTIIAVKKLDESMVKPGCGSCGRTGCMILCYECSK